MDHPEGSSQRKAKTRSKRTYVFFNVRRNYDDEQKKPHLTQSKQRPRIKKTGNTI
ncbi:hypothetical protein NRIC_24430 [Enterococcus florum]|uniref:Uncharacterized protein n=1 Tax=Enterococcus florum TaxID=2480627 RepID=A0A4P5PFX2_9ENTE|nr:hypothetical protein NRIC_24430 [Enterococcus florum]